MVRAKFRCMSVNEDVNGQPFNREAWLVQARLLPIKASPYQWSGEGTNPDKDFADENAAFWKYTPNGEACWFFSAKLGAPYYIDMVPDPDGAWKVTEYTLSEDYLNVKINHEIEYEVHTKEGIQKRTRLNGEFFTMGVSLEEASPGAWKPFVDAGPGSRWSLTFTLAD